MTNLFVDVRYALRSLFRRPGFTVAAVLALAVGIGLNTAIFSSIESVLLRPLPFPNPEQLMSLREHERGYPRASISAPDLVDWRAQSKTIQSMSGFTYISRSMTLHGTPEFVRTMSTDSWFFHVTGEKAELGSVYEPGSKGGEAVLSHGAWTRFFGMDPKVIGSTVTIETETVTVVGVLPEGFHFPQSEDVWISARTVEPIGSRGSLEDLTNRGQHYLQAIARLKPDVSMAAAEGELKVIGGRLEKLYPNHNTDTWGVLQPLHEHLFGEAQMPLFLLMAAAAGVLLIACFNVASLQLASIAARRHELAIRSALGASSGQIARQVLVEGAVLSLMGGAAGVLLAAWGVDVVAAWGKSILPAERAVTLDLVALAFGLTAALVCGVGFSVIPAISATRLDPMDALQQGGRIASGKSYGRTFLVAGEVAVALVLLVGTGLLGRSFLQLRAVDVGVDPTGLFAVKNIDGPKGAGKEAEATRLRTYQALLADVQAIPGVTSAALVVNLPLSHSSDNSTVQIEGEKTPEHERRGSEVNVVTPTYFQTMRIPLLQGRLFDSADRDDHRPVAIVNEAFCKRFLNGRNPIGVRFRAFADWTTVVGVVADVRQYSVQEPASAEFYLPLPMDPQPEVDLVMRSTVSAEQLTKPFQDAVQRALPGRAVRSIRPMSSFVESFLGTETLLLRLVTAFSVIALGLAMLGVYGVIAYSTQQRTREIGIRSALGAQPNDILRMVMGGGFRLVALGLAAGIPIVLVAVRLLRSQLFGVEPFDPVTMAAVSVVIFATAMLASFLPARRATKLDPMAALRYE